MWSATTSGDWRVFCYQYGGETKSGLRPSGDEGIWRSLSVIKLSSVEWLDRPWRTDPHAPQRCVGHVEVDADDYPGGDPQKGRISGDTQCGVMVKPRQPRSS